MPRTSKVVLRLSEKEREIAERIATARGVPLATCFRLILLESPDAKVLHGEGAVDRRADQRAAERQRIADEKAAKALVTKRQRSREWLSRGFYQMRREWVEACLLRGETAEAERVGHMTTFAQLSEDMIPRRLDHWERQDADLAALGGLLPEAGAGGPVQAPDAPTGGSDPFDTFTRADYEAICGKVAAKP